MSTLFHDKDRKFVKKQNKFKCVRGLGGFKYIGYALYRLHIYCKQGLIASPIQRGLPYLTYINVNAQCKKKGLAQSRHSE